MPDTYAFYRARCRGDLAPETPMNEPQHGFWECRRKSRPSTVIAIFPNEGQTYAVEVDREGAGRHVPLEPVPGKDKVPTLAELWPYISMHPVTQDRWEYYKANHRLPEEVGPDHNQPPANESLADQIHSAAEEAMREIKGGIESQLQADRAANHRDRMLRLKDEAETARKEEKAPHIEAGKAVDARWGPAVLEATNAVAFIRNALTPFLRAQKEAAEKASPGADVKAKAGTGRRRTGLRVVKSAKIVDWDAAALALLQLGSQDLRVEIQRLANRVLAAGGTLAGCELVEKEQAQ